MKKLLVIYIILMLSGITLKAQYKVIVNVANPVSELTKKQVSDYFLKKQKKWDNKTNVIPIDLNSKSAIRNVFSKDVHHKSTSQVRAYWQQMIFAGRGTPPREVQSEEDIISYVKKYKGAIGYVSNDANTSGVKVLTIK